MELDSEISEILDFPTTKDELLDFGDSKSIKKEDNSYDDFIIKPKKKKKHVILPIQSIEKEKSKEETKSWDPSVLLELSDNIKYGKKEDAEINIVLDHYVCIPKI